MAQDLERIAQELAPDVARRLLSAADPSRTEADFRREAALILDDAASRAGVVLTAREEYQVARGRADSVYGLSSNMSVRELLESGIQRRRTNMPSSRSKTTSWAWPSASGAKRTGSPA